RCRKYSVGGGGPEDIAGVERRAFYELVWESAGRLEDVSLYSKPLLAAVGCGMDISRPCGNMRIDCGAGTTELSVLSLGGIVKSRLLKYGGNQIRSEEDTSELQSRFDLVCRLLI